MIPGRPAGDSRGRRALPAREASQRGSPVSGKALPAHEASQRGTPVSGEALPAHEAGQRGTPVICNMQMDVFSQS